MLDTIPESFEMLGHKIRVVWVKKLVTDDTHENCWGQSNYEANVIELEKPGPGVDPEILHQTFWHEWMHFARHYVVPNQIDDEEKFADLMGAAMHQYHRTKKFPKTRKRSVAKSAPKKRQS